MERVDIPLTKRMQNFLYTASGKLLWTSASLSPWQRLERLIKGIKEPWCNTSWGSVVKSHGQNVYMAEGLIPVFGKIDYKALGRERKFLSGEVVQGLSRDSKGKYTHVAYGLPNTYRLIVEDRQTGVVTYLMYSEFKQWWWKDWEAEGLQWDNNGKLKIGICVKVKYIGIKVNYVHEVQL